MEPLRSRQDLTYAMEGTAGRALLPLRRLTASIHESFLVMGRADMMFDFSMDWVDFEWDRFVWCMLFLIVIEIISIFLIVVFVLNQLYLL